MSLWKLLIPGYPIYRLLKTAIDHEKRGPAFERAAGWNPYENQGGATGGYVAVPSIYEKGAIDYVRLRDGWLDVSDPGYTEYVEYVKSAYAVPGEWVEHDGYQEYIIAEGL
jgi:hypothetical protein